MDGDIKSIGDLKIVIDASTEKFSGNIKSARDMIAQFGTDGSASLSKFDSALVKTGDVVDAAKGKLEKFSAALPGVFAVITRGMQIVEMFAGAVGKSEEIDDFKSSIVDLGKAVNDTFATHFGAATAEVDLAKKAAVDYEEKLTALEAKYSRLGQMIQTTTADLRVYGGVERMTADDLDKAIVVRMLSIKEQQRVIEDMRSGVRTGPVNEFIGDISSIEAAEEVLKRLNEQLEILKTRREELSTGLEFYDATDALDKLRKQNAELELQNETLGMAKEQATEYLAIKRALAVADQEGKPFSIADYGQLLEEAALLRENMKLRSDYEAGIRDAERQRKERERQEKGIDDIDNRFDADMAQIQAKTLALTQSARAAEEMAYFERMMADARRKNIELTDADIEGIRAQAKAIADANDVMRQRQKELNRWQEDSNMFSSNLLSEFSRWTQGAEFSWKRMVSNMLAEAARLMLLRNVLGPLFGGGGTDFRDSMFGSIFGGFRATGGPVEAGRSYLVGENGPEVVTMGANAHVTPSAKGDTYSPTINIDARGATADAVAMLEQRIPSIVMNTMTEARQRGLA